MRARTGTTAILSCLSAILLLAAACGRQAPTSPRPALSRPAVAEVAAGRVAGPGTIEGDIGPGAHYVLSVPAGWMGDLVVYAHGYTAPIYPVGVPPGEEVLVEGLRGLALQSGLAFAYSTYSQTGLGLQDAVLRTEQLLNVFRSRVGPARRTFLIGTSFGGLAAIQIAESAPDRFAGVLTLSGMTGGTRAEIDYVGHVRALFDLYYPGTLPGNVCSMPGFDPAVDLGGLITSASAAIAQHPEFAFVIAQVTQTPLPYTTNEELGASLVQALVLHAVEVGDLLARTHGQCFFDNSATVYTGNLSLPVLADLNQRVARYTAGPAAAAFLDRHYEPSGNLRVPLITMHTSLDPVVPAFHQALYRARVEARGREGRLHEITVARYGHVMFAPAEVAGAFQQLLGLAGSPSAALADR